MSIAGLTSLATSRRSHRAADGTGSPRPVVASARETVALVLDEEAPVPESGQDVDDLLLRLRGHVMQLGPIAQSDSCSLTLSVAQKLASSEVPGAYVQARVHLRNLAIAVQELMTDMGAAGLVCAHLPECPSAQAEDCQAARVRVRHPEAGFSVLCNGVLLFDDTGCLTADNTVVEPRRPLPVTTADRPVQPLPAAPPTQSG